MSGRGRGRGRGGFGRGKPFPGAEQLNLNPTEKVPTAQISNTPFPVLDHFPAPLSTDREFDEQIILKNQMLSYFQSSHYHLKLDDENSKLFSSQGEISVTKKTPLNFNWDYFPLELRPTNKRKLKDKNEILANLRKDKLSNVNLTSWLDKLEEKEKTEVQETDIPVKGGEVKKETEEPCDEEEEFDDEELDDNTDYNTNYFDNGEGYLDEDDDLDEGPCY